MPDLTSTCASNVSAQLSILDRYSARTTSLILPPGDERSHRRSLLKTFGWYDVAITVAHDTGLEFQYAGHVENGRSSTSDPAIGGRPT